MTKIKLGVILEVALVTIVACGLMGVALAQAPVNVSKVGVDAAEPHRQAPPMLEVAPLNPDLLNYLENRPEHSYGYIPPPMDTSHINNNNGILVPRTAAQEGLPSAFDWRDSGDVTPVKDQRPCGTCWVFGTLSALESRVSIVNGTEYDFSEQNAACCTDPSWVYLDNNRCDGGGWSWLATDVLIKKGTRLESCDPYNTDTINTEPCDDSCSTIKRITGYRWITDNPNDISEVKDAIYNDGPVSMAFYIDDAYLYPGSIYYYPGCTADANHLVSIVGWDDGIAHPLGGGSGAWIVKNSWGTDWGDSGYFYLCYGSANMQEVASYRYQDYDPNENLFYWDEAGMVGSIGSIGLGSSTLWMGNVFNSGQVGNLTHVEFWTTSNNAGYELYVYDGSFGTQLACQAGTCDELGYYSIPLSSPVSLTNGQQFSVAVEMTTPGYDYPLPVECYTEVEGVVFADPPIQTGVSFYSTNGNSWDDLGLEGYNACLRAIVTTGPSPDLVVRSMSQEWVEVGSTYNVTFSVCNEGTASASASVAGVYIDGSPADSKPVASLDVDECSDPMTSGPFTLSGKSDSIEVRADKDDDVEESNENNNSQYETFPTAAAPSAEGGGCFIATAAYGTSTATEIDTLKAFRDEVLLENSLGSQLVEWYYQTSPPVADFISEHEWLRDLVREFLVDPVASVVEATETLWRN